MLLCLTLSLAAVLMQQPQSSQTAASKAPPNAPAFEVATIRPSPEIADWAMQIRGTHFVSLHTTLDDLITYAYDVHVSQIVAPSWFSTARFDIEAVPNTTERPTREQFQKMVQELLAERYGLAFHRETRSLPAFTLAVADGGPKLAKAIVQPGFHPGWGLEYGALTVNDMTVEDFARLLQRLVLDRPVVDRTGLSGHFDFALRWKPDESQFTQMQGTGVETHTPKDTPDAPDLYTAMNEQLGLKLRSVRTPVDVLVIDRASPPSPN